MNQSPAIVETRPATRRTKRRSWEKEVLIVGGLIFDLTTRDKK
jgi:hypothetical protein